MKNLALILVLFLSVNTLWAQQQQKGGQRISMEERQKQELKELKSTLELTAEQEKEIVKLQTAFTKESKALRSGMTQNTDRKAMRDKMTTLRKKYDTDVKALLTDEQKAKYDKLIAKRQEQMQGQRQGQKRGESQGKKRQRN